MDGHNLYSVRMRASRNGRHVSGAERLVLREEVDKTVEKLVDRAKGRGCKREQIALTIDRIDQERLRRLTSLDVVSLHIGNCRTARKIASLVLQRAGVSPHSVRSAIALLSNGAAPSGWNMRGAVIMDSQNGERLEPDQERGVRASKFDWSEKAGTKIDSQLSALGLTHFRTREALALATKVAHAPGLLAELCWSDEPDYTAGYAASLRTGYVRFPFLKKHGVPRGGRVFFVDNEGLCKDALIRYLQDEPTLIVGTGVCRHYRDHADYLQVLKSG
jgi:6-carboxyhexanoate--CoA ligase